jgi:mannose-6-phosphate isomerase-like protein (cupin superfamily)
MDSKSPSLKAAVITPADGSPLMAFGLEMRVLLGTDSTGGATSVLMVWHQPGEGPPDHVHFSQEEIFFIVEGTYEVVVDGMRVVAGPGSIAFVPRKTVHRFKNIGSAKACMLDWTLPGGQERYFKAISELTGNRGFIGEQVLEISRKHDVHFPADN